MAQQSNSAWLRQLAKEEDNCVLSVGGLALAAEDARASIPISTRAAFARFVQLYRRDKGLTIEQLAQNADIDIIDIVNIERGVDVTPEPRTIYNLAEQFKLATSVLMQLAGLAQPRDQAFAERAIRFAARSAPVEKLTPQEHRDLEEYVKYLAGQ
jgi:HTH-type transcriptional regulator, competence development regulator